MAWAARRFSRRAVRGAVLALSIPTGLAGLALHQRLLAADQRDKARERWLAAWARMMLRLFGVRLDVVGASVPSPARTGRLVIANHRSAIDIGLLFALFAPRLVSRADVAAWPLLGWGARRIGTLFVDRSSVHSGAAVLKRMRRALAAGDTVGLFPEGTTFTDDVVRPFRAASFAAVRATTADVLPVGIAYGSGAEAIYRDETFLQHLSRIAAARETRVALVIGAPLLPADDESADAFCERAHEAVQRLVDEARVHVDRRSSYRR